MNWGLRQEIKRKIFHFLALLPICFFVYLTDNNHLIKVLPFVLVVFIFDFFNLHLAFEKRQIKIFNFFFSLLREHERKKYTLSGSTWILISIIVCFFFNFDKSIQFTGFFILAFSDSLAAVIGKKYGRIKMFNKTLEGGFVFFISSFCLTFAMFYCKNGNIVNNEMLFASLFISICISFFELTANKTKINDNFLIPVSFCFLTKFWSSIVHYYFFN